MVGDSATSTTPRSPGPAKPHLLTALAGFGERHRLGRLNRDRDEPIALPLRRGGGHVALGSGRNGQSRRELGAVRRLELHPGRKALRRKDARIDPGRRDGGDLEVRPEARLDVEDAGNVGAAFSADGPPLEHAATSAAHTSANSVLSIAANLLQPPVQLRNADTVLTSSAAAKSAPRACADEPGSVTTVT